MGKSLFFTKKNKGEYDVCIKPLKYYCAGSLQLLLKNQVKKNLRIRLSDYLYFEENRPEEICGTLEDQMLEDIDD
jgi:hypothetical protein